MTAALPSLQCPHCGATYQSGSAFCEACGKALPSAMRSSPRIVGGSDFAQTSAGMKLQADDLHRQAKRATSALRWVAIIQTIFAGIIFMAVQQSPAGAKLTPQIQYLLIEMGIVAVVFWGLYIWSLWQILPAVIVGLVIYSTLVAINLVDWIQGLVNGKPQGGFGGIIIMIILVRGVVAGVKHRKLMQQSA
jgi:hypothetical protein